jgi:hypothetical protein
MTKFDFLQWWPKSFMASSAVVVLSAAVSVIAAEYLNHPGARSQFTLPSHHEVAA